MKIDLSTASYGDKKRLDFCTDVSELFREEQFSDIRPCEVRIGYEVLDGTVKVIGECRVNLTSLCYRCGDPVTVTMARELCETFIEDGDGEEFYAYTGNIIDLTPMLRDLIITNFPTVILCSEDCRGLCFECGTNLNHSDCKCDHTQETGENPFEILKNSGGTDNGSSKDKNIKTKK
ncbi:MAG: DUF177 domain-containing protein [Clostridiales bacterium]|jgi:uncharacterized protein|nr:DUF177 domain-containing protein [Clostridiales bacterium]